MNSDDPRAIITGFGALISAMGGGGDAGNPFPQSDADDFQKGARFIPGEVTLARRAGESIQFVQSCPGQCCWHWELPNGNRIYHFEENERKRLEEQYDSVCPSCENTNISGGTVAAET